MTLQEKRIEKDYEVNYPDVDEYTKEEILAFEKEVLGIYVSGHPLEDYKEKIQKNVSSYSMILLLMMRTISLRLRMEVDKLLAE